MIGRILRHHAEVNAVSTKNVSQLSQHFRDAHVGPVLRVPLYPANSNFSLWPGSHGAIRNVSGGVVVVCCCLAQLHCWLRRHGRLPRDRWRAVIGILVGTGGSGSHPLGTGGGRRPWHRARAGRAEAAGAARRAKVAAAA